MGMGYVMFDVWHVRFNIIIEGVFKSYHLKFKSKQDCNYPFPIYLAQQTEFRLVLNLSEKVQLQSKFGLIYQDSEKIENL